MLMFRRLSFVVVLAVTILLGCSKRPVDAPPKSLDLGVVQLVYGTPSRHELGNGEVCVLRAESLGAGTAELIAVLEKSGKEVSSTRVAPANIGRPLELSLGNFRIQLTPQVQR